MPKIIISGKNYIVHWKKEWDDIIYSVVSNNKYKGSMINWSGYEAEHKFDGIPDRITLTDIMKRWSWIKRGKVLYVKKQKVRSNPRDISQWIESVPREYLIQSNVPKTKRVWSQYQIDSLNALVENYTVNRRIDWIELIKDPFLNKLPYKILSKIRSYYFIIKSRKDQNVIEHNRKYAREYKKRHHTNNNNFKTAMYKSISSFLSKIIHKRGDPTMLDGITIGQSIFRYGCEYIVENIHINNGHSELYCYLKSYNKEVPAIISISHRELVNNG